MEQNKRRTWIIVAIVVFAGCCVASLLAVAVAGAVVLGLTNESGVESGSWEARQTDRSEYSYEMGASPELAVDNFAGSITIRGNSTSRIEVVAIKRAPSRGRLAQIEVKSDRSGNRLSIETRRFFREGNAAVELEISVPEDTELDLNTGAGTIDVRNTQGEIRAHSGAGEIRLYDVSAEVRAEVGAGKIEFEGRPEGSCHFQTGAGEIELRFPQDLSAELDLSTGLGTVSVSFPVTGRTESRHVRGEMGPGPATASVSAQTGLGSVRVTGYR
jgi:hypothetical protein